MLGRLATVRKLFQDKLWTWVFRGMSRPIVLNVVAAVFTFLFCIIADIMISLLILLQCEISIGVCS